MQVLADVVARPTDVLAACLTNMLPSGRRVATASSFTRDHPADTHTDLQPTSQYPSQHPAPAYAFTAASGPTTASQPTIPSLPSASTPRPPPSQAPSRTPSHASASASSTLPATPEAAAEAESSPEVSLRRRVVGVLVKMLTTPASACRPSSPEALRLLGFFVNSLSNPQLTQPDPLVGTGAWRGRGRAVKVAGQGRAGGRWRRGLSTGSCSRATCVAFLLSSCCACRSTCPAGLC